MKNILTKNKKGSHVGIILSFTLFITSILFIYNIANSPIKTSIEKYNVIETIKNNFINYNSESVFVIRIPGDTFPNCVRIERPDGLYDDGQIFGKLISEGKTNEIGTTISDDYIYFQGSLGAKKLYYTNNSPDKTLTVVTSDCSDSNIFNVDEGFFLMEKRIIETFEKFKDDYADAKEELDISKDYDVVISFEYPNGNIIKINDKDVKDDVYANKYRVEFLSLDGDEEIGNLIIKIW
jgi:hypothetical protein